MMWRGLWWVIWFVWKSIMLHLFRKREKIILCFTSSRTSLPIHMGKASTKATHQFGGLSRMGFNDFHSFERSSFSHFKLSIGGYYSVKISTRSRFVMVGLIKSLLSSVITNNRNSTLVDVANCDWKLSNLRRRPTGPVYSCSDLHTLKKRLESLDCNMYV